MEPGKRGMRRRMRRPWSLSALGLVFALSAGCMTERPALDQSLKADYGPPARRAGVADCYLVHCPDALDVRVDGRLDLSGVRVIGLDGRIDLGAGGVARVERQTVPECSRRIAEALDYPPDRVHVQIAEFNSQQIYLYGQVTGLQRALPYQGPQTVVEVLQRAGGITTGAAPDGAYVVRAHFADSRPPEVFTINLPAILKKHDERTNLRLLPFDQVYIGETRPSCLEKCVPPWLRPMYESLCGLRGPMSDRAGGALTGAGQVARGEKNE